MKNNLKFYLMSALCCMALVNTQVYSMNYNNTNMNQNMNYNNKQYNQPQSYNNQNVINTNNPQQYQNYNYNPYQNNYPQYNNNLNLNQNMHYNNQQYNQQQLQSYNNQNMIYNNNRFLTPNNIQFQQQQIYNNNNNGFFMPNNIQFQQQPIYNNNNNGFFIPNNNQAQQKDNPNDLPIYKNEQNNQQKNLYDGKKKDIKRLADSCKDNIQFETGLQNIGATCYMNSVLQCLHKIPELTKYLMENSETIMNKMLNTSTTYKYWNNMNHNEITIKDMSQNAQLMMEYLNLTANLSNGQKYYAPNTWKQKLGEANPLFAGVAASDSKDLIIFLLEAFHTSLYEPLPKNNNKEITDQYDRTLTKNNFYNYCCQKYNSRISDLFYGVQESFTTCQNCKKTTYNFSAFSSLIFPMREVNEYNNKRIGLSNNGNKQKDIPIIPLDSCFGYNEKTEFFNGDNKIYCSNCSRINNGLHDAINGNRITIFPDNLILICNRDRGNTFKCKVPAPETLDLSKYETESSSGEKALYDLQGIITHIGESGEGGHFIAYCKLNDGWYQYNDARVNKIDGMTKVLADDVSAGPGLENTNYIYFYKRKSSSKMQQVKQMYLKQNSELQSQQNNNQNVINTNNQQLLNNKINKFSQECATIVDSVKVSMYQKHTTGLRDSTILAYDNYDDYNFEKILVANSEIIDSIINIDDMVDYMAGLLTETKRFYSEYNPSKNASTVRRISKAWPAIQNRLICMMKSQEENDELQTKYNYLLIQTQNIIEKILPQLEALTKTVKNNNVNQIVSNNNNINQMSEGRINNVNQQCHSCIPESTEIIDKFKKKLGTEYILHYKKLDINKLTSDIKETIKQQRETWYKKHPNKALPPINDEIFKSYFMNIDNEITKPIEQISKDNLFSQRVESTTTVDEMQKIINDLLINTMKFEAYYELPPRGQKHPHQRYYLKIFQRWILVNNRIKAIIKTGVTKNDQSQNLSQSFTQLFELLPQIRDALFGIKV